MDQIIEKYFDFGHFDLVSPDGRIIKLTRIDDLTAEAIVFIDKISPVFVGFKIDPDRVFFNIKSTLAQVGLNGIGIEYEIDSKKRCASIKVILKAIGPIAKEMLKFIEEGAYIGKLFAADERRRVRDAYYLSRMFGRSDRWGDPLLSLGGMQGSNDLVLDQLDGRTVAYITLQNGCVVYEPSIYGFLPTIGKALVHRKPLRGLLRLHQTWNPHLSRHLEEGEILLVRSQPLHIRTVFGKVVDELLAKGFHHTTASVLQPDTQASGDIYELYGSSKRELSDIALEFYTLEPYREYVFFTDRDQLQTTLEDGQTLFKAFETAPKPIEDRAAVFIVKGEQLLHLTPDQWIVREPRKHEFPGLAQGMRQALMVERYISQQPSYPFLKAIDEGHITSQGILLTRYFPSPLMKRMLLSDQVQRMLKGIYFQYPSQEWQGYFSSEDRALLNDLEKFAIPVNWVDEVSGQILRYARKEGYDSGLFVPLSQVQTFLKAVVFGIYGSNLLEGTFEEELRTLMQGVIQMKSHMEHPKMNKETPLALVTGGGPGAMEVGNRVAKELGILSCANIVDFRVKEQAVVNEQKQNTFIDAKMTYRLDKLVERQAEFNLDFPIFLMGGIGTDFEFTLEEVRRKVGSVDVTPILIFGTPEYWEKKITARFQCNLETGTIKGSEWLSNCFYCIQTAQQGIRVYRDFFLGKLPIGRNGPIFQKGFVTVPHNDSEHLFKL